MTSRLAPQPRGINILSAIEAVEKPETDPAFISDAAAIFLAVSAAERGEFLRTFYEAVDQRLHRLEFQIAAQDLPPDMVQQYPVAANIGSLSSSRAKARLAEFQINFALAIAAKSDHNKDLSPPAPTARVRRGVAGVVPRAVK